MHPAQSSHSESLLSHHRRTVLSVAVRCVACSQHESQSSAMLGTVGHPRSLLDSCVQSGGSLRPWSKPLNPPPDEAYIMSDKPPCTSYIPSMVTVNLDVAEYLNIWHVW
jgi:hypothetical protein